jgi:hypothetical protein
MHLAPHFRLRSGLSRAAAAGLLLALTGCGSIPMLARPAKTGPFYSPKNFSGEAVLPVSLHRVLLLPVCGGTVADPESVASLDVTMRTALQRQARFEVVSVSREDCRLNFGATEFSSAAALPHGFLEKISRLYAVDAVMFVDVTIYQPYRPLTLGFRAKLATIQGVHLAWTFDESFSTADPAVVNSVNRFYLDHSRTSSPVDLPPAVQQSPGRLAAFAADAMFGTLPPR